MKAPSDKPVQSGAYGKEWIESAWGRDATRQLLADTKPRPRVARALELANIVAGQRVLDIACGRGEVPALIRAAGGIGVGLDFSEDVLGIARDLRDRAEAAAGGMHLVRADAARLPFADGSFDRILMLDIVEHLTDEQLGSMFRNVRRLLAPQGYAVVHTLPNRWVYNITYPLLARLLGRATDPRGEIERQVHINEQSLLSLKRMLKTTGFESHLWLEQLMPAQARWNAGAGGFGDQRDRLYPKLARWPGRILELLSATPAKLLLSNDIFAVIWPAGADRPAARLPLAFTESLACCFA
jgi:ubiquinone/menaquinone biosynthesis C-methylase UbiE